MKGIPSGQPLTQNIIILANKKRKRQEQLKQLGLPVCQCDRCRLDLDKDIDYDEYKKISEETESYISILRESTLESVLFGGDNDFQIDWHLFLYLRYIYGENSVHLSKLFVMCFVLFALYSRHATKPLIKLWYKQMEPSILISYGREHPIYKLFRDCYQKTT